MSRDGERKFVKLAFYYFGIDNKTWSLKFVW